MLLDSSYNHRFSPALPNKEKRGAVCGEGEQVVMVDQSKRPRRAELNVMPRLSVSCGADCPPGEFG